MDMKTFSDFQKTFKNFSPLDRGEQKTVYSAEHPEYGCVVIKLYFKLNDPRTEREIEIGRQTDIQCVPKLYETGFLLYEGAKTQYTIEERIIGNTLRERIETGPLFTLSEAVDFLGQGLTFIKQIEKKGIVHRDIKPDNIIISNDGTVYFIDFGIARILGLSSLTETGALLGPHTPGYAAPEQFNNLKSTIDSRADLFSIGVVTYECITGQNPFREDARSALEVLQKTETITPVEHRIQGDTQQQFMALLSSLMGKYPSRRPRNATQALKWLESAKSTFQY